MCERVHLVLNYIKLKKRLFDVSQNERVETRGRKPLSEGEPTVRSGICLPISLYKRLMEAGEKSGEGFSHHVRLACEKMYPPKRKPKAKKKKSARKGAAKCSK